MKPSILALASACMLALAGCHAPAPRPAEAATAQPGTVTWKPDDPRWGWVKFMRVQPGKPIGLLPVSGRVAPMESALWSVQAPLDGRVEQVLVRVGQPVKRNQPLAQVRSTGLADLRHDLALARQTLAVRVATLGHLDTLAHANAVAGKDLLAAQADVRASRLDVGTLERKLDALGIETVGDASYILRAPQDGVVVKADVMPGAQVGPGTNALLQLAKLDRLVVWAQVLESDLDGMRVGDSARILAPGRGDRQTDARIDAISKAVDPDQHTIGVRLVTGGPVPWLYPNGYVQVEFQRHAGNTIVVPAESVVTDDLQSVAFVKTPDGRLERRPVVLGRRTPSEVEVVKGLAPGDTIVTTGAILVLNEVSQ